jgi:hypothetical protein
MTQTPGPWRAVALYGGDSGQIVVDTQDRTVAMAGAMNADEFVGFEPERARLIAAAPDLLAALKAACPEQPMSQDEQGGCVWCGGYPGIRRKRLRKHESPYAYATADPESHNEDCAWLLARAAIARAEGTTEKGE